MAARVVAKQPSSFAQSAKSARTVNAPHRFRTTCPVSFWPDLAGLDTVIQSARGRFDLTAVLREVALHELAEATEGHQCRVTTSPC